MHRSAHEQANGEGEEGEDLLAFGKEVADGG
jgi:hypothetical protein